MTEMPDNSDPLCGRCRSRLRPTVERTVGICVQCQHGDRELRRAALKRINLSQPDRDAIERGGYERTKAVQQVTAWLESGPAGLVLCGGVGVGKTFAAGVALWRLGGGDSVRALEIPQRTDPWGDEGRRYRQVDPNAHVLVIDDLGVERDPANPRWAEAFERLIDARASGGGRTLLTTNLRKVMLRERYGDRIADRLNHFARAAEIAGKSMRRQGGL